MLMTTLHLPASVQPPPPQSLQARRPLISDLCLLMHLKLEIIKAAGQDLYNYPSSHPSKPSTETHIGNRKSASTMSDLPIPSAKDLTKLYINGSYILPKSGETYKLYNPTDASIISDQIPIAGPEDVDAAVTGAEEAFTGPWSEFSGAQRSACLRKLAQLLDENDRLIQILTLDALSTGNPVSIIPTREKGYIMGQLNYYGNPPSPWMC